MNLIQTKIFSMKNNFQTIEANYFSAEETSKKLREISDDTSFSLFHLNIRSMNKNFEQFNLLLGECQYKFSIICLTETWCSDETFRNNSNFQLDEYDSIHLGRKNKRGGGICLYVHNSLSFKTRNDLSIINEDIENLCIEIINKK